MPNVIGNTAAGFKDASLWEDAKKSEARIKKMIDDALVGTSVTINRSFCMPRRRSPGSTRLQASGGKRLKHLMQAFQRYLDS